jgi:hypothetical protein
VQTLVKEPAGPLAELEQLLVSVAKAGVHAPAASPHSHSPSPSTHAALSGVLGLALARGSTRGLACALQALLPIVHDAAVGSVAVVVVVSCAHPLVVAGGHVLWRNVPQLPCSFFLAHLLFGMRVCEVDCVVHVCVWHGCERAGCVGGR